MDTTLGRKVGLWRRQNEKQLHTRELLTHTHLTDMIATKKATLQEKPSKGVSLMGLKGDFCRAERTSLGSRKAHGSAGKGEGRGF